MSSSKVSAPRSKPAKKKAPPRAVATAAAGVDKVDDRLEEEGAAVSSVEGDATTERRADADESVGDLIAELGRASIPDPRPRRDKKTSRRRVSDDPDHVEKEAEGDPAESSAEPTALDDTSVAPEVPSANDGIQLADSIPIDPDDDLSQVEGEASPRLMSIVESILFASNKPMSVRDVRRLLETPTIHQIQLALKSLIVDTRDRGVVLSQVAGGFRLRTNPDNARWVQRMMAGRPVRLSRSQLEALAVVAYRQPITKSEVDHVRGVDCGAVLKTLLDRDLIKYVGRKEEAGRPHLYGTTVRFLEFFNLRTLRDMPSLQEFQELTEESEATLRETLGPDDLDAEEDLSGQETLDFGSASSRPSPQGASGQETEGGSAEVEATGEMAGEGGPTEGLTVEVEATGERAGEDGSVEVDATGKRAGEDGSVEVEATGKRALETGSTEGLAVEVEATGERAGEDASVEVEATGERAGEDASTEVDATGEIATADEVPEVRATEDVSTEVDATGEIATADEVPELTATEGVSTEVDATGEIATADEVPELTAMEGVSVEVEATGERAGEDVPTEVDAIAESTTAKGMTPREDAGHVGAEAPNDEGAADPPATEVSRASPVTITEARGAERNGLEETAATRERNVESSVDRMLDLTPKGDSRAREHDGERAAEREWDETEAADELDGFESRREGDLEGEAAGELHDDDPAGAGAVDATGASRSPDATNEAEPDAGLRGWLEARASAADDEFLDDDAAAEAWLAELEATSRRSTAEVTGAHSRTSSNAAFETDEGGDVDADSESGDMTPAPGVEAAPDVGEPDGDPPDER